MINKQCDKPRMNTWIHILAPTSTHQIALENLFTLQSLFDISKVDTMSVTTSFVPE